ncbi:MAG: MlaD family protein [Dysgonomonas sp.]
MEKKKISKEVKIGIAFVIALAILYFGISFLKGVNIFKPTNSYQVVFDDVSDLTLSSPVVLNGYQIGLVYSMELDNKTGKTTTVLNLDKGVRIPKNSKIKLSIGMLGGAKVVLIPDSTATEYYSTDDLIIGVREKGMMEALSENMVPQIAAIVPKIDSILTSLQTTISDPKLSSALGNVDEITHNLARSTQQLNILLAAANKDVPKITANMAVVSEDLTTLTGQVKSMDLKATYNSVDSTLKNIQSLSERINSKDNSIGLLLNDRQLYDSLTSTLNNASILLKDVKENPSKYINVKVF